MCRFTWDLRRQEQFDSSVVICQVVVCLGSIFPSMLATTRSTCRRLVQLENRVLIGTILVVRASHRQGPARTGLGVSQTLDRLEDSTKSL